jgi:hypothetical protein
MLFWLVWLHIKFVHVVRVVSGVSIRPGCSCSLFVVRCSCSMFVVRCSMFDVRCSVFDDEFDVQCSMKNVPFSLSMDV